MQEITLSPVTLKSVEYSLKTYHGVFFENKCSAQELEEILVKGLRTAAGERADTAVEWTSGSHSSEADIKHHPTPKRTVAISVKSGKIPERITKKDGRLRREEVILSGHRLGKSDRDPGTINHTLKGLIPDVLISFVYQKDDDTRWYQIIYIDAAAFQYPKNKEGWNPTYSRKNPRKQNGFTYTAPNGMFCKINFTQSDQLWWTFPFSACRLGPRIYV